ncbi:hypothetical protein [Edwardsiella tarda]
MESTPETTKGGVTVYISPDIVAALEKQQLEAEEAGKKVGLDPLCYVKPSIGYMVRMHMRIALGLNVSGGE